MLRSGCVTGSAGFIRTVLVLAGGLLSWQSAQAAVVELLQPAGPERLVWGAGWGGESAFIHLVRVHAGANPAGRPSPVWP